MGTQSSNGYCGVKTCSEACDEAQYQRRVIVDILRTQCIGEDGQSDTQICQTLSIPAFDQDTCHDSADKQPKQIGGGYAIDLYFAKT